MAPEVLYHISLYEKNTTAEYLGLRPLHLCPHWVILKKSEYLWKVVIFSFVFLLLAPYLNLGYDTPKTQLFLMSRGNHGRFSNITVTVTTLGQSTSSTVNEPMLALIRQFFKHTVT
jgi:hypothetical protein